MLHIVKYSIAWFLLVLLAMGLFSRTFVAAHFYYNQSYIVLTLCENKNKPQMKCNGKCYLAKQLKKVEPVETKSAEKKDIPATHFPEILCETSVAIAATTEGITKHFTPYRNLSVSAPFKAIPLRPPIG